MRIVSLLASATEIVCALGAGQMLAGRSHECDNPAWVRRLPACSEPTFDVNVSSGAIDAEVRRRIAAGEPLYRVDNDRIAQLAPDLILTQSHCEVCAVTPDDIAPGPILSLSAFTVNDVFESIRQIGARLGLSDRAEEVIARERARIDDVRERTKPLRRPTVGMIEWTDPLFSMGNWGPELVDAANAELPFGRPGEYSAVLPPDKLIEANPEFLIVAPCGFNLQRAAAERETLERYPWWSGLRAVRENKVAFADGNLYFNRSGMTIARTAEIVAEILHGEVSGESAKGTAWQW